MLEYLLFVITVGFAFYRPAVALAILLQIYVLRVSVSSNIDITCNLGGECNVENSPLFGAVLPILVFGLIAARTLINNKGIFKYQPTLFDYFFIANILVMTLASLWSPDFMNSLNITARYILLAMPFFFVTRLYFQNCVDDTQALKQFLLASYIIAFLMTLLGVYYYLTIGPSIRMSLPGSHPIPYSMLVGQGFILACGIFFTGGKAVDIEQSWFRILNIGLVFFFLFCQFLTNTRGVTIFMGLAAIILLFLNLKKIGLLKISLATPFIFLGFVFILSKFDTEALFARFSAGLEHDQSANERLTAWYESIEMLAQSPILGVGTDGYRAYGVLPYPHNYFLEMATSFGILGIILVIVILGLYLFYGQFLSEKRGGSVQYQLVYVIALFSFLESTVSFTLWMHKGLYLWLGILMIMPQIIQRKTPQIQDHNSTSIRL